MRSYIRTTAGPDRSQWLTVRHQDRVYYPCLHHATIDQNRPYGDSKTFREHAHPVYHLVLYTANRGGFRINGRSYRAEPGTLVVVSPGQPHDFVTERKDAIYSELTFTYEDTEGCCLSLPVEVLLRDMFGVAVRLSGPLQLDPQQVRHLKSVLIEIIDYAEESGALSRFYEQRALLAVFELMIVLGNVTQRSQDGNVALSEIHDHIRKNFHLPLDIDHLAVASGISRGYLFRIFKREYQMTPLEYQQQLRIEAARTLLRTTSLRCNEIATRVGYENNYYFHRVFRARTGLTPRQFRQTAHRPASPAAVQSLEPLDLPE